jgi:3-hydroxyisobutyrate dehydrogenase
MKRVGFIGLGNMGFPMARNILRTGIEINAFDLSDDAMQKANELGMKAKRSAKEVLEDIDALITMLPNDAAVENIFLKENLLEEINDNIIIIESSTINPQVAKKVSAKAVPQGYIYAGCPSIWRCQRRRTGYAYFYCWR